MIREDIANLQVYMPSTLPKRYVGTDLAEEICNLIASSLPDNPYKDGTGEDDTALSVGFNECLNKIKKELEG